MAHWYTIDDADQQIAYSGAWGVVQGGGNYMGSAHSTTEVGASATLVFKGTGIKVWMSIPTGDWNQISGYHINGDFIDRHIECHDVPGYNELTFIREGLGEGPHTIVITQEGKRQTPRGGAPVQLDRIEILTSPADPNPAPIYPAGVSPPNNSPQNPPSPSPAAIRPPATTRPPNPSPTIQTPPSTSPSTRSSDPPEQSPVPVQASPIETSVVVTSGSSTFTVASTIRGSELLVATQSHANEEEAVKITKVIPTRHVTTTDSTGGISVRTEFVESGANKDSGLSRGLLVGVIVAVLLLALCFVGAGLFLWKRKQRRKAKLREMATTRTFGEHLVDSRAGGMVEVNGNPFITPTSSSPSSQDPFDPTSTEQYRADVEHLPSVDAHRAADDAPPAYQVSSNPAPVITFSKERGNR